MTKRVRGVVDGETSLLRQCVANDVWEVIEENFTMIDMLVLCWVSRDMRLFAMERLQCLGDFLYCALLACKPCGSRSFSHFCVPRMPSFGGYCAKEVKCITTPGVSKYTQTYRTSAIPLQLVTLCDVDETSRSATILCVMKDSICYNWGSSHTLEDNLVYLVVPLGKLETETSNSFYAADDAFHLANGIYNAALCRKDELVSDDFLFNLLC